VIKLLPYISLEKYIYILALEMASSGNRHYAYCIGALSSPIDEMLFEVSACAVGLLKTSRIYSTLLQLIRTTRYILSIDVA